MLHSLLLIHLHPSLQERVRQYEFHQLDIGNCCAAAQSAACAAFRHVCSSPHPQLKSRMRAGRSQRDDGHACCLRRRRRRRRQPLYTTPLPTLPQQVSLRRLRLRQEAELLRILTQTLKALQSIGAHVRGSARPPTHAAAASEAAIPVLAACTPADENRFADSSGQRSKGVGAP